MLWKRVSGGAALLEVACDPLSGQDRTNTGPKAGKQDGRPSGGDPGTNASSGCRQRRKLYGQDLMPLTDESLLLKRARSPRSSSTGSTFLCGVNMLDVSFAVQIND